jgi:hypothetical protein
MKKSLLCLLVLSSTLAGCIVVPLGRPWHHERDGYYERGAAPAHEEAWRR